MLKKIIPFLALIVPSNFIKCKGRVQTNSKSYKETLDGKNDNWQTSDDGNIKFEYPTTWRIKSNQSHGTTWYRLTNEPDTTTVFFPVEIWEFLPGKSSCKIILGEAPYGYFMHETDGKNGDLISTEPSKIKNFQANTFE